MHKKFGEVQPSSFRFMLSDRQTHTHSITCALKITMLMAKIDKSEFNAGIDIRVIRHQGISQST